MKNHRLSRLTLLTQGIALIGFGMSELACAKEQPNINGPKPDDQLHINAPPQPTASDSAVVPTGDNMPHMNATATPPSSASAAPSTSGSTTAPPKPLSPPHTNAPRKP
jgi:hypothetical protein